MTATPLSNAAWLSTDDCRVEDLEQVVAATTDLADYPHAERIEQGVVVYSAAALRVSAADPVGRRAVLAELARVFADGPGIAVFTGAFESNVIDPVTEAFDLLIAEQKAAGRAGGDHFAKPGANDRVWNGLEKLAVAAPDAFVDYYANDIVALASTAWLGPRYQVTSQVNVVNPGGQGQTVHRDYHLGFLSAQECERYPLHVHRLSMTLTLQGAVAHCDMPVESGPTLYLPHSQKYTPGYLAYWREDFQEYFVANHVQLPLRKGDAVFFNPALFHAAGTNHTAQVRRMANLLQVSSGFGRAMEAVDRTRVVNAIYPALLARTTPEGVDGGSGDGLPDDGLPDDGLPENVANVIAASAEGYPFPTNLDRDQPIGGMTPLSQAELLTEALANRRSPDELADRLAAQAVTKLSH